MLYEDGQAASIIFEGLPGGGEFSPDEALRRVGLSLPGNASETKPTEEVTRWSWFNSEARLLIDRRQYRVEVSNIGGAWDKTRVDVVLNDPRTDALKAKILQPSGAGADAGAGAVPERPGRSEFPREGGSELLLQRRSAADRRAARRL